MKISIATTGTYEPTCFDFEGQEDASKPYVKYKLLTGEQVEAIQFGKNREKDFSTIFKEQVTEIGNIDLEIDGKKVDLNPEKVVKTEAMFSFYFEVAKHILSESIIKLGDKKKL